MLIRFAVENFLSFKDKQELSMIADMDHDMEETHCFSPQSQDGKLRILKSAAIYGANASGKSNFIKAILFMREWVLQSTSGEKMKGELPFQPFKLSHKAVQEPGFFEVDFLLENIVYNYGFRIDRKRVVEEWLNFYPQNRKVLLFNRVVEAEDNLTLSSGSREAAAYDYKFGSRFKGEKHKIKSLTREDALYLSVGAQFAHPELTKIFKWFEVFFKPSIKKNTIGLIDFTSQMADEDVIMKKKIINFLKSADLGIKDITTNKLKKEDVPNFDKLPNMIRKEIEDGRLIDIKMVHTATSQDKEMSVGFSLSEESQGTQRMFQLSGPLLHVLTGGGILIIDEIEDSLHFNLVKTLLSQFFQLSRDAQIIFTTHNVQLLEERLFRRDEIWFTEKNADGGTELFSLTDFKPKPRKDKSLKNGYLTGVYGAIPVLGDLLGE